MKKIILLLIGLMLIGCGTQKKAPSNVKGQITYDQFKDIQKTFYTDEGNIKYVDKGSRTGPVVLLLHGVPTSGWLYRKMLNGLVNQGYRIIVPDMLGFGASDSPDGYEIYSEQNHARRIIELMDFLAVDSWSHVVHDAGGLWTWELFKQAPDRINKLVILNTVINDEGFYPPVRMKPGAFAKTSMWAYRNGVTTNTLLSLLFKDGLQKNTLNEIDLEGYKAPLKEGKTLGMYYFFTQTCNDLPDYTETFYNITVPVAVIWGIHDTMLQWPPQQTKVMKAFNISRKNVHLIDEKHFIQETKYQEINEILFDFFN